MWKSYFKTAIRNLLRQKVYATINILGLSVGLTAALLLYLYIDNELSYEKHYQKSENIYRVNTTLIEEDKHRQEAAASAYRLAPLLKKELPEVIQATRVFSMQAQILRLDENKFPVKNCIYVDSAFFNVFPQEFILGNPKNALTRADAIVINETTANKIFGSPANAMNKTLKLEQKYEVQVTGVIKDVSQKTHLPFEALISMPTLKEFWFDDTKKYWRALAFATYVLVNPNTPIEHLREKLPIIVEKNINPKLSKIGVQAVLELQTIHSINLYPKKLGEIGQVGNLNYIYIFGIIALSIILIASINYINLNTARAVTRAKEVGIRKVIGAYHIHLIGQFMLESLILVTISLVLSLLLVEVSLPVFNQILQKDLYVPYYESTSFYILLGVLLLFVTILSGFYPSLVLASFVPVNVLKGKFSATSKGLSLRKFLVIFQFSTSILMMIATFIIYQQLQYIQKKDLGFQKEQVLVLDYFSETKKWDAFKDELLSKPQILEVSRASASPGLGQTYFNPIIIEKEGKKVKQNVSIMAVAEGFIDMMQISVLQGNAFDEEKEAENRKSVLVNEAFVKQMNWQLNSAEKTLNPIGKYITMGKDREGKANKVKIIGVVKNFHLNSLYNPIEPLLIKYAWGEAWRTYVKVQANDYQESITFIEKTWEKYDKRDVFRASFLENVYLEQYQIENKIAQLVSIFATFTILIACLGLFGLSSYLIQVRYKEIGVRKVLGASTKQILFIVSKDIFSLIAISGFIALPLGYFIMDSWLKDFSYKISLIANWWGFLAMLILALTIAFISIFYHAWSAMKINPVKVLRQE